jgi:hypothetical protein
VRIRKIFSRLFLCLPGLVGSASAQRHGFAGYHCSPLGMGRPSFHGMARDFPGSRLGYGHSGSVSRFAAYSPFRFRWNARSLGYRGSYSYYRRGPLYSIRSPFRPVFPFSFAVAPYGYSFVFIGPSAQNVRKARTWTGCLEPTARRSRAFAPMCFPDCSAIGSSSGRREG